MLSQFVFDTDLLTMTGRSSENGDMCQLFRYAIYRENETAEGRGPKNRSTTSVSQIIINTFISLSYDALLHAPSVHLMNTRAYRDSYVLPGELCIHDDHASPYIC